MKFLTLAILATTLLSTAANANISASSKNINVEDDYIEMAVSSTSAPFASILMGLGCASIILPNANDEMAGWSCLGLTTVAPISTSTLLLLKEEAQEVEADAYNFLAGEEISLALAEQMNKMREAFPKLANSSDEEVIALMLEMAKI